MPDNAVKFTDIPDNHWALGSIIWSQKFLSGYEDGTFRPKNKVSREEMVAFLHKYHDRLHINLKANLVKNIKPSVVVVKNTYTDAQGVKRQSIGTGTIINEDNQVLTNYHCIADDQNKRNGNIEIGVLQESRPNNTEQVTYYQGTFITGDSWIDQDVAVVQIEENVNRPFMPILSQNLEEGDDVISYGHGGGYLYAVGSGVIAQDLQVVGGLFTFGQTDATINAGNSGGLISSIYNKAIAGIPTRKATQHDNINFYLPANRIIKFLDKREIKYHLA